MRKAPEMSAASATPLADRLRALTDPKELAPNDFMSQEAAASFDTGLKFLKWGQLLASIADEVEKLEQQAGPREDESQAINEAVEALRFLVELKDGPRDEAYRAAKPGAWEAARVAVKKISD